MRTTLQSVCRLLLAWLCLIRAAPAPAGGPLYVAGTGGFDAGLAGTPLTWAGGRLSYYTDQGSLSPVLPPGQAPGQADDFVAQAFAAWTSIPTAAVSAIRAGQLDEDVNGSNVTLVDGVVTLPTDIQPTALNKPVAIVYDADGQVTDALLGQGAGSRDMCPANAAFGGVDNFASDAHLAHALVVINGNCVQTLADKLPVKYRLVRVLGRVLGLDWSQLNAPPAPTPADYPGFPVMHANDSASCGAISACIPPRMDDRAALSRLYPVTAQNLAGFPGKQLFRENTGAIHGSVYFAAPHGLPGQPMQGVNVVARWIDPSSGVPSRQYAAASVTGFLFRGNAGNPVSGFLDSNGQPYDRFGSAEPAVEGWFDLSGLEFPDGGANATYQLTLEPVDPLWGAGVGPYRIAPVRPSGAAAPVTVTIAKGSPVTQDLVMTGSATEPQDRWEPNSFSTPSSLAGGGEWAASLSPYGDADYYRIRGQADRTLSVEVTALNERAQPSQEKARPVVGMWPAAAPEGSLPEVAEMPFNTNNAGMTRLSVQLNIASDFTIGVADERGDGRPDFRYKTRVFYGDSVWPAHTGRSGGLPLRIRGTGFRPGTAVTVGGLSAPVLSLTPNQIIGLAPSLPSDGAYTVALLDPATGATASLINSITYGTVSGDRIVLLAGANPAVPVGGEAPNPLRLRVAAADGFTPVAGASVALSVQPSGSIRFSACGASSCTLLTDGVGEISTRLLVLAAGALTVTAALPPFTCALGTDCVRTTIVGTSSPDAVLSLLSPNTWALQGASFSLPLTARVLKAGIAVSGATVNYFLGSATTPFASATSNLNGEATATFTASPLNSEVLGSACLAPSNAPCQNFHIYAVAPSALKLEVVSGGLQVTTVGQPFQPVTLRVTDSSSPPIPVYMAGVQFTSVISRWQEPPAPALRGEAIIGRPSAPLVLSTWSLTVNSDTAGLVRITPLAAGNLGAVAVDVYALAGTSAGQEMELLSLWAPPPPASSPAVQEYDSPRAVRIRSW